MKTTLLIAFLLLIIVSTSGCINPTGHVTERSALQKEIESVINESDEENRIMDELSQEMESMPLLNETETAPSQNETAAAENTTEISEPEPTDLCADISCPEKRKTCPDGYEARCQTACDGETGECASCDPDCTGHDVCEESWECGDWSGCSDGQQTRTCSDANSCGTTKSKPPETRSCEEPELALYVTVTTDKPTIIRGNPVTITTSVTDGINPVEGAEVFVVITYASTYTTENSSFTDHDGNFIWIKKIGGNSVPGIFTVNSTAAKEGYISGEGCTTFEVVSAS